MYDRRVTMSSLVNGVVLAGGRSRRMGGKQKPLALLHGQTLIQHVINIVQPQVNRLLLNVNDGPLSLSSTGLPTLSDSCSGHLGPLAGILTGMEWTAREYPDINYIFSTPVDCPFLPKDLVGKLLAEREAKQADLALATSADRIHYTVGLWPVSQKDRLRSALLFGGIRRVEAWVKRHSIVLVDYKVERIDPFANMNSPEDLLLAETLMRG